MKSANAALIALLDVSNAAELVQCDLYTFTLLNGTVARFSNGDIPLTIGADTFQLGPKFHRGSTKTSVGLSVDDLQVDMECETTDTIGGVSWLEAFGNGWLDGCRVLVERFISDAWTNTTTGKLFQFEGRMSKIESNRMGANFNIVADTILLNINMPRNVFQPTCLHTLYDAGCSLNRATFTVSGTVVAGTVSSLTSNLAQASGYFNLGAILFTSGPNSGRKYTVRTYLNSGGTVTPIVPFLFAPLVGNTFTIYPGCNKVYTGDCSASKFNNQANFLGEEFIPEAETAY